MPYDIGAFRGYSKPGPKYVNIYESLPSDADINRRAGAGFYIPGRMIGRENTDVLFDPSQTEIVDRCLSVQVFCEEVPVHRWMFADQVILREEALNRIAARFYNGDFSMAHGEVCRMGLLNVENWILYKDHVLPVAEDAEGVMSAAVRGPREPLYIPPQGLLRPPSGWSQQP